jgi:hypothetical protein
MRKPRSAYGYRPGMRWQLWLAVLLLTLVLSGARHASTVQAAPPGGSIGIWLLADPVGANRTLCVGDQVQIRLTALKRVGTEGAFALRRLVGVNIAAAVVGSGGVGSISPASSATTLSSHLVGAAYFSFEAEKPGTVIVEFTARVNRVMLLGYEVTGSTVKTQVVMQVEDCKYRVSLISRWRVPGEAQLTLTARVMIAGMVEDGGGHYSGTARVQWIVYAGQVGDCQGTLPPDSQARVVGQVYGPDEFILDVDYDTALVPLAVDCKGAGGNMEFPVTPAPLTFSVSAGGGQTSLAQVLRGPGDTPGVVTVVVKRAAGQ